MANRISIIPMITKLLFITKTVHFNNIILSVERQKGLTTGQFHTQLDPFVSKLTNYQRHYDRGNMNSSTKFFHNLLIKYKTTTTMVILIKSLTKFHDKISQSLKIRQYH